MIYQTESRYKTSCVPNITAVEDDICPCTESKYVLVTLQKAKLNMDLYKICDQIHTLSHAMKVTKSFFFFFFY